MIIHRICRGRVFWTKKIFILNNTLKVCHFYCHCIKGNEKIYFYYFFFSNINCICSFFVFAFDLMKYETIVPWQYISSIVINYFNWNTNKMRATEKIIILRYVMYGEELLNAIRYKYFWIHVHKTGIFHQSTSKQYLENIINNRFM